MPLLVRQPGHSPRDRRAQVDTIASEIHDTGQIAIVSASASDTNQNTWISA